VYRREAFVPIPCTSCSWFGVSFSTLSRTKHRPSNQTPRTVVYHQLCRCYSCSRCMGGMQSALTLIACGVHSAVSAPFNYLSLGEFNARRIKIDTRRGALHWSNIDFDPRALLLDLCSASKLATRSLQTQLPGLPFRLPLIQDALQLTVTFHAERGLRCCPLPLPPDNTSTR